MIHRHSSNVYMYQSRNLVRDKVAAIEQDCLGYTSSYANKQNQHLRHLLRLNSQQSNRNSLWKQATWLVVTEVRSESFGLVTECRHYNARLIYGSGSYVRPVLFFIVECSVARFLCAVRVFDVSASSSPLPLWKFCIFFRGPHCWARPRKQIAYSIIHTLKHSVTHSAYLIRREPKLSLRKKQQKVQ